MKIGTILSATDNNPLYSEFIPIFVKAWKKILPNTDIKIYFIADNIPDNLREYSQYLELIKPIANIKTAFITQNIRILAPRFIERDEGVLITDIDILPLNQKYYVDTIKDIDSSNFIVYRKLDIPNELQICYNVAKPSTWKSIFGENDTMEMIKQWYSEVEYNGEHGGKGWSTDQNKLYKYVTQWKGTTTYLSDDTTGFKRLNRGYDDISINDGLKQKIANGEYSDYHALRPYSANKDVNDFIVDSIPQYGGKNKSKKNKKSKKKNLRKVKKITLKKNKQRGGSKSVIALCADDNYLEKAYETLNDLRNAGKYSGEIVFFYNDELKNINRLNEMKDKYNIILKQFPKIDTASVEKSINSMNNSSKFKVLRNKMFQYHKFYIFNTYFKEWDKVLYIDSGMHIFNDINRILQLDSNGYLLAQSDGYPSNIFTLESQFDINTNIGKELQSIYNLKIKDFFQSGVLLFNTTIIEDSTFNNLVELMNKYPIGWGDQSIMNIYFIFIKNIWKALPTKDDKGFLYNITILENTTSSDYVMVKNI